MKSFLEPNINAAADGWASIVLCGVFRRGLLWAIIRGAAGKQGSDGDDNEQGFASLLFHLDVANGLGAD